MTAPMPVAIDHKEGLMAARSTPADLNVNDVLAVAREKLVSAIDATAKELDDSEAELAPLRARMEELNAALAGLDGKPTARSTSRELTDDEKERRRIRRQERRAARKAREMDATPDAS
jgi:hypothetical protein